MALVANQAVAFDTSMLLLGLPTDMTAPKQSHFELANGITVGGTTCTRDLIMDGHYFGTYPVAAHLPGEPPFSAAAGTPFPDGLHGTLLTANPNARNPRNGTGATDPFRLNRSQAATADQNHGYRPEQTAFDNGAMDLFPYAVGRADSATLAVSTGARAITATKGLTMGHYDGNTVTALWNYAQHYALNDRSFGTTFGPSVDDNQAGVSSWRDAIRLSRNQVDRTHYRGFALSNRDRMLI